MSRRGSRPALYELSRRKLSGGEPSPPTGAEPPGEESPTTVVSWFTPGIGVRVPVGFLVLAAVVLVAAVVLAWWVGYGQGVSRTEALMASNPSGVFVDPLNQADMGRSEPTPQPPSDPVTSPANPPSTPPGAVERPWHFVLAETNLEGADRLAAFCLEHGLEVMVISRHNTGLARIIALPGQASSSRDTASVRAQEDQIVAIGRRWKQNGGRTDFSDRYMDRIEPAPR